jgi:hypothetical protein
MDRLVGCRDVRSTVSIKSKREPWGPRSGSLPDARRKAAIQAAEEAGETRDDSGFDPHAVFDGEAPEPRSSVLRWLVIAAVLGFAALLVVPIRIPSLVRTFGRIQPAHEWVLVRGVDGQLSASVYNHETGVSEGYRASSFDRSSSVYFTLNPGMVPGRTIARGDTVGIVASSETQERLIALNGELATAQRLLAVNKSGEKEIVVQAAEQRLLIAQRKRSEQEKSFTRSKALFAQGILPQGQYESAENAMHGADDEVALSSAALAEARSGAKPEQLDLVTANIAALKEEIDALRRRAATHTITSPLSGLIARSTSDEILLSIADTSRYIAMIPIRLADAAKASATPHARVTFRGLSTTLTGTLEAVDHRVTTLGTERVVLATALLDRTSADLVMGLPLRCDITCPPVTTWALVKQFLFSLVS